MLVDCSGSFEMNLVVCFITATTIIVLMLFVADMDDIERGFFTVDTHGICEAYHLVERHINKHGGSEDPLPAGTRKIDAADAQMQFDNPMATEEYADADWVDDK